MGNSFPMGNDVKTHDSHQSGIPELLGVGLCGIFPSFIIGQDDQVNAEMATTR